MDQEAFITLLRLKQGKRSLREYATDLGVSAAYLSDVYLGRRSAGPKIAKAMGYSQTRTVTVKIEYTKLRA